MGILLPKWAISSLVGGCKNRPETHFKKIKSLWLGLNEGEEVILDNEKIYQVYSFIYLVSSKNGGCNEEVKSRMAKVQWVFQLKKFGRAGR